MELDPGQLRALAAVVATGSLEAAAKQLHITPSGVSQRLRALEAATGRVLLVRSRPARPTPSGEAVLRLARQVEALAAGTAAELGLADDAVPEVVLAVNADSLATWVLPALAPLAAEVRLDLRREDESRTAALLREGVAMAAVTTDATPVPGCTTTRLGAMRYRPVASPDFVRRWFPDGPTPQALTEAPVVVFDRSDRLQHEHLARAVGHPVAPPAHHVPGSSAFVTAVRLGLGWGMLPDLQSAPERDDGSIVELDPHSRTDVVLHWQQWRLRSPALDRVGDAVIAAALAALV